MFPDKRKEYGPWVRKFVLHKVLLDGTRIWFGFYYVRRVTVFMVTPSWSNGEECYEIIQEAANILDMMKYPAN